MFLACDHLKAAKALGLTLSPTGNELCASPSEVRRYGDPGGEKAVAQRRAACFRNCMHGVSGAGWGNFCDSACYGR